MDANKSSRKPHFVLVPFLAQGHIIPMIDLAILLADLGARVSLITTPVNADRGSSAVGHRAGRLIDFIELPFPCAAVGLPEGCENVDLIPLTTDFMDNVKRFFSAASSLRDPFKRYLQAQLPAPACMIADALNPWTRHVAEELRIPRLLFHGPSCFYILCSLILKEQKIWERVQHPSEPFDVPGMGHNLRLSLTRLPWIISKPGWEDFRDEIYAAEVAADGVVINTFDYLERPFVESYSAKMGAGKKTWTIGPLSLAHGDSENKAERGNKACADAKHRVLRWLDRKPAGTVVYVCFGSLVRHDAEQLLEIGRGLEESGRAFVWVIKEEEFSWAPELEKWLLPENGIVLKGWAPQAAILAHPAVGGFVTHCGWNSTLEAAAEGVPMATWPHSADQFANEKLVVDVLGIAVAVISGDGADAQGRVVKREEISEAVRRLMGGGAEGEGRRRRAKEVGRKAKAAMEEGGSSHANLTELVKRFG